MAGPRNIPPIVSAEWIASRSDPLVLADVRWYLDGRSGQDAYRSGHLPNATFVDLNRWLAAPPSPESGRHPLPTPEHFAEAMSELGIGDETLLVAYDDAGGVIAARLVWMLRSTGHAAALLDGGIDAWTGPLETGDSPRVRAQFDPTPWPVDRLATIDQIDTDASVVIDARPPARYRGDGDDVDPRAGHIPGAKNIPCREHLDESNRFLDSTILRDRFSAVGITEESPVISYCGSGVTACHNLLVLESLGYRPGRLYVGSWSQWSADPLRAIATGSEPG